jgi:DHA1 family inner membrane transport protein
MAYLGNRTVNLVNLHYALHTLAMSLGGVFFAVYLLKAGLSVAAVLVAMALILFGRFLMRPLVLPIGRRIGLRGVLIAGSTFAALQYLLLAQVHGVGPMLVATLIVSSVGETLYWTSYHAYFAAMGDAEHRGHQVSAREAVARVVEIAGPVAGGWALTTLGPLWAFGFAAVAQALAALPLLGTPKVEVPASAPGALASARLGIALFASDGWIASGFYWVWQIALFQGLGRSFTAYGGAMALAAAAGAVLGLVLGRHIDAGHGRRAVWLAFLALSVTVLFRAGATTPALALAANAMGALVACLHTPTLMTAVYNLSKDSPCVLRFHMATEGGFDLGCGAGLLAAAGLLKLGTPLNLTVLVSLLGAVATLAMLRGYYARLSATA